MWFKECKNECPPSPFLNLKFSLTGPDVDPEIYKFLSPWYLGPILHCDNAAGFLFKVTYYSLVVINTLAEIRLFYQKEYSRWINTNMCGLIKEWEVV